MNETLPKSFFELLDLESFRKRAGMYIGAKSISKLRIYMDGYQICEIFNEIKSKGCKPPFWLFYHWICKYYRHSGSYYNWDGIILQNCDNDEEKAFDTFLQRFDEFREFKPQKLITAKIGKSEIDFFNSHKGIRWTIIKGEQIRIGPADHVFIVEYNNSLGCSIHHQKDEKEINSDYFTSIDKAIHDVEREYGMSLNWREIPKDEMEHVYERIV